MLSLGTRIFQSSPSLVRCVSRLPLNRPSPPPLPPDQQREFEELVRNVQTPLNSTSKIETDQLIHPDSRKPVEPDFQGDENPVTGEIGGPKKEPVRNWGEGDWSHAGRVTDF